MSEWAGIRHPARGHLDSEGRGPIRAPAAAGARRVSGARTEGNEPDKTDKNAAAQNAHVSVRHRSEDAVQAGFPALLAGEIRRKHDGRAPGERDSEPAAAATAVYEGLGAVKEVPGDFQKSRAGKKPIRGRLRRGVARIRLYEEFAPGV